MLSRTHGQTASPTTVGKEIANVVARLARGARAHRRGRSCWRKMNGAVGNYNAHLAAYPDFDWEALRARASSRSGSACAFNPLHDPDRAARLHGRAVRRDHAHQHDPDRLVRATSGATSASATSSRRPKAGEVGSIDDAAQGQPDRLRERRGQLRPRQRAARAPEPEAADQPLAARPDRQHRAAQHGRRARLRGAGATTRWRAAWTSSRSNAAALAADLDAAWEVLAEPIQTVMRRHGLPNPYEQLKELTRGKAITREAMQAFIRRLAIPPARARAAAGDDAGAATSARPRRWRGASRRRRSDARRDAA